MATKPWRWWFAAAGIAAGFFDAWLLQRLGLSFSVNGQGAGWVIGVYFGVSFAALGFLVGELMERRRRDRATAALLQAQTETIAATRARLAQSEKLAALGQLAAQIAHEVRNPLAVIRSAAQDLGEAAADDPSARRASSFVTAEIDRLNNVITSLLAFARPLQLSLHSVRVPDLLERALLLARDDLAAKRIRVHRGGACELPGVRADADLISQVFLGLLANALEAAPEGSDVSVETRAVGGAVEVDVADSGPGVAPDLRQRIFEPFFTTRARGTGLGLAIARQIVEAHAGRIEVRERPGGGACFTVRLPAEAGKALAA